MFPSAGHTRTPLAGLGAPFLGSAHVELPLPFVRRSAQPSVIAFVPQNTFLDNHKPSTPFPDPTEKHTFVLKPCFFLSPPSLHDQLLGVDRCLAYFLSSIHEEERTDADVNTGNDTNKNRE